MSQQTASLIQCWIRHAWVSILLQNGCVYFNGITKLMASGKCLIQVNAHRRTLHPKYNDPRINMLMCLILPAWSRHYAPNKFHLGCQNKMAVMVGLMNCITGDYGWKTGLATDVTRILSLTGDVTGQLHKHWGTVTSTAGQTQASHLTRVGVCCKVWAYMCVWRCVCVTVYLQLSSSSEMSLTT